MIFQTVILSVNWSHKDFYVW